jgi:hypothetical protein
MSAAATRSRPVGGPGPSGCPAGSSAMNSRVSPRRSLSPQAFGLASRRHQDGGVGVAVFVISVGVVLFSGPHRRLYSCTLLAFAKRFSRSKRAPGRIRTCDHKIRSHVLYPAELRGPGSANANISVVNGDHSLPSGHNAHRNVVADLLIRSCDPPVRFAAGRLRAVERRRGASEVRLPVRKRCATGTTGRRPGRYLPLPC